MVYISSNDSQIYYEKEGQGEIILCCVYGFGSHLDHWLQQRPLEEKYQMIYIDLAGHGKSTTKRKNFTMEAHGEDVAAVIENEQLDNVILVGWSMGGIIILEAAKLLGERVIGLIGVESFFPYLVLYQGTDE